MTMQGKICLITGVTYTVPWTMIGLVAAIAYAASLLTTFLPARRRRRSTRRRRCATNSRFWRGPACLAGPR